MSTQPGVTSRPSASTVRVASSPRWSPTPVIRPSLTVMSAVRAGAPVPSTTVPPWMTRSCMVVSPPWTPPGAPGRCWHARGWDATRPGPLARRDGVGDLRFGHEGVIGHGVEGDVDHGQACAELEQGADGDHVDQCGLAQEVDVEAGGHGEGHRSDLADHGQPRGTVGQGHEPVSYTHLRA